MLLELIGGKDAIVRVVGLDFETKGFGFGFNKLFATDSLGSIKVLLEDTEQFGAGMINIHGPTGIAVTISSPAIGVETPTANWRGVMISGQAITG